MRLTRSPCRKPCLPVSGSVCGKMCIRDSHRAVHLQCGQRMADEAVRIGQCAGYHPDHGGDVYKRQDEERVVQVGELLHGSIDNGNVLNLVGIRILVEKHDRTV